ncbi:MAG: SBBP repeat-containing protein [Candidatus Saccharicenans sp.]
MKSKPGRSFFIFILFLGTLISVGGFLPLLPLQGNFSGPGLNQFELGKIQSIEFLQKNVITWPLYFIPNLGQLNGPVDFYLQGRDKNIYFNREGLIIALNHIRKTESIESNNTLWATRLTMAEAPAVKLIKSKEKANINRAGWKNIYNYQSADDWNRWVVKLSLVGANPEVTPIGLEKAQAKISYFRGSPDHWLVGIPTYSKISYPRLWPGINLNLAGDQNSLKSEFFIEPGADLSCLRLKYEGISGIYLNAEGQLEIQTPAGNFVDDRPFAYQIKNGQKIYIPVSYKILEQKREPSGWLSVTYTFKFGAYDPERPLYLDPAILIYSGYLGGSSNDRGLAVAIDSAGNAYLTGWTASYDFPVSVGPDPTFNGPALGTDAFVAKINPSGTGLIYCGYLGGSFDDSGNSISVDSSGNAYVCGFTKSPDFPVVVGPFTNANGNITQYGNGFITKINADGTALIYSGYLGGSLADQANGVAVDSSGRAYVCGTTESSDFPTKTGPFLRSGGLKDAFVLRIAASGSQVDWSGFIGGTRDDIGSSIAVDSAGNAYVTGYTASTPANQFPVKNGPKLTQSGGLDAFVAKVDTSGASLLYCGYIGGSSDDYGSSIAVDSSGNAYITGATLSATNFPATVGPDVSYNGGSDAFVAKINPTSTALLFCGYVGGSADDFGTSIAVDAAGLVYLVGATESANFPVTGGPFLTYHGNRDAFVCVLRADGQGYYYSSFLGGSDLEEANGVAADGAGNIYVAGFTRSADFPTLNGPFLNPGGGIGYLIEDAFITRIYGKLPPLAPQNLRLVNVTDTEANLAWDDKSNNEDGFKIERKTGVPGSWNQIALVGANITAYKNTGLTEATTYYYRVRAYNDIGDSLYSNELSVLTRPAAPSNLVAKVINERQIDLTWNDNSSGETGFRIERKIGSGNWTTLTTLAANVTSYSDTSVIETTTYSYRVFAFSGSGDSASSNEVTVTTPALTIPLAPSNLQAQAVSASQVSLSWTDNSYNEDGFKIERKTGAGGTWNQAALLGLMSLAILMGVLLS